MKDIRANVVQIAEDAAIHATIQTQTIAELPVPTRKDYRVLPGHTVQDLPDATFAPNYCQNTDLALLDLEANNPQLCIRDGDISSIQGSSSPAAATPGPVGTSLSASRWANEQTAESQSSCKAITFGVECEHVLAFRQDELEDILRDRNIPYLRIQKTHSVWGSKILLSYGREWGWTVCPSRRRQQYPSWVIVQNERDAAASEVRDNIQRFRSSETFGNGDRHNLIHTIYTTEPFLIAKRVLTHHSLDVDICAWVDHQASRDEPIRLKGSKTDFKSAKLLRDSAWTLTRDASVIGLLKSQLIERSYNISKTDVDRWDSHGVELVSPIFDLTSDGKQEACTQLGARVEALKDGRTYDMLESIWAGLHVHVGFDVAKHKAEYNQKLRGILQHLSYLLIAQEPLITSMFPKSRSGRPEATRSTDASISEDDDRNSIQVIWADEQLDRSYRWTDAPNSEDSVLAFEAAYTGWADLHSNRAWVDQQSVEAGTQPSDADRRSHIFQGPHHWPQVQHLDPENGNEPYRCYIYNFSNIHNYLAFNPGRSSAEKPTVEFRQHECCLDVKKIRHWLDFLEAIFCKAEALYEQEGTGATYLERQSSKYGPAFPFRSLRFLCHWLDLDEAECDYWEERQASFQEHHRLFHDEQWRVVGSSKS